MEVGYKLTRAEGKSKVQAVQNTRRRATDILQVVLRPVTILAHGALPDSLK